MSFEVVKKHLLAPSQSMWSVSCRNKYVITGSVDGKVRTWQQDEPYEMLKEFNASPLSIVSVANSGPLAIASSLDSRIKAWEIISGEQVCDIDCGPVDTWAIACSPSNPNLVATTGQSGHVNIWDIKSGAKIQTLETPNAKFTMSVAWSLDGKLIACGSTDGIINIFSETGAKKHTIVAHTGCIRALSFSSDSRTLVSGSDDTFVHVYETGSGQLLRTLSGHSSWVLAVAIGPNGKYIASGSNDKNVKIWDLATGECLSNLNKEHTEAVWSVSWNNDGSMLFAAGDTQLVMYRCLDK